MTSLGLGAPGSQASQMQVGFRGGWVRSLAVKVGGAGLLGVALALVTLAKQQPAQVFDLLERWGFWWLLGLVAMLLLWDLAKIGLAYFGNLADSVRETAVAMSRIADKDDRERDRMVTETAFGAQRREKMAARHEEWTLEQREHNERVERMLERLGSESRT